MSLIIKNKIEVDRYNGVTNVIQNCGQNNILLLPCSSSSQLEDLLEKNLPLNFKGLIVSTFKSKRKLDQLILDREEIKKLEIELIDHFYPIQREFPLIGVTGTNGKTSVCWLCSEIARLLGKRILYMGTPGAYIAGEKMSESILTTTPSYLDLRRLCFIYDGKFDGVALEVSSHALAQERLKQFTLDAAAWTNFTQDHLDFHKTMEEYFIAKKKIIKLCATPVFIPSSEVSLKNKLGENAIFAKDLKARFSKIPPVYQSGFTRANLEVALSLSEKALGLAVNEIDLDKLTLPPGRFQEVQHKNRVFIIDYAHTPDALKSLLDHIRHIYPQKEIITVFGCGGDRDRAKRPLMGQAAFEGSDKIIVTSDNPRTENPQVIIQDIISSLGSDVFTEVDRRLAVKKAFEVSHENSIIVVAGKGHEDYQEINGIRHKQSDESLIREL